MLLSEVNEHPKLRNLLKDMQSFPHEIDHWLKSGDLSDNDFNDQELKKQVVRSLLLIIKDCESGSTIRGERELLIRNLGVAIKFLRKRKVNWPELDVIEKSTKGVLDAIK